MQTAARLETTIEALDAIAEAPAPADVVLQRFFRARRFIGSKDRAAIAGNVYRTLRSQARLMWWLEQVTLEPTARYMALADQLLNEKLPLADLHNLCTGGVYCPKRIIDFEHEALKKMNGAPLEPEHMPETIALECPPDLEAPLRAAYGERFNAVLRALQRAAPLDVRVNTLRADTDTMFGELKGAGFNVERCVYAPHALRLLGRPNLNAHPAFSSGAVEIQDEGSQLIAALTDARPGMRVMDFCAGAGGKTLALAATMKGKGRIVATDNNEWRLQRAKLRLRRADVQTVELHALTDEHDTWLKRHKDEFDRVLVDAPCSGTGTWRRNPESRWRYAPEPSDEGGEEGGADTTEGATEREQSAAAGGLGIVALQAIQKSILESAARMVSPGGKLVYATCSLLPGENEKQVEGFLASHPLFSVVPVQQAWRDAGLSAPCPVTSGDYLRLDPAAHNTDGFFAAILERKKG